MNHFKDESVAADCHANSPRLQNISRFMSQTFLKKFMLQLAMHNPTACKNCQYVPYRALYLQQTEAVVTLLVQLVVQLTRLLGESRCLHQ